MMSAWQYAETGPFTPSPAAQRASSETVIFWSASVVETTTQVTTPAIAMMMPTTMAVIDAVLRMSCSHLPAGPSTSETRTFGCDRGSNPPAAQRDPLPPQGVNADER